MINPIAGLSYRLRVRVIASTTAPCQHQLTRAGPPAMACLSQVLAHKIAHSGGASKRASEAARAESQPQTSCRGSTPHPHQRGAAGRRSPRCPRRWWPQRTPLPSLLGYIGGGSGSAGMPRRHCRRPSHISRYRSRRRRRSPRHGPTSRRGQSLGRPSRSSSCRQSRCGLLSRRPR